MVSESKTATQEVHSQAALHELCILSFNETLTQFKNSPQKATLFSIPIEEIVSKEYPIFLRKYNESNKAIKSKPWKIDYTSKESFRENRGECEESTLKFSVTNLLRNLCSPSTSM